MPDDRDDAGGSEERVEDQNLARIPEPIRTVLCDLRTDLEEQGSVQRRPNGTYRLRFKAYDDDVGCGRHRSVNLGRDAKLADVVRSVIAQWRVEASEARKLAREEEDGEAREERLESARRRIDVELAGMAAGAGRDQRRALLKELEAAIKDGPAAALKFAMGLPSYTPTKPGRKRKGRLW